MNELNARQLLARVMQWADSDVTSARVAGHVSQLQLLADLKYDHYQRFQPGKRFIESLALWLEQFDPPDRGVAFDFVLSRLVFISDGEFSHLVQMAFPDVIAQERLRLVADEQGIPRHCVGRIASHRRFRELAIKSLYLGLSDGARTNELRRASEGEITNEQIWHAHELGEMKAKDMAKALAKSLQKQGYADAKPHFTLIWLLDDFSGSGNTYIRYDNEEKQFKGKLRKIYDELYQGTLVDRSHHEVYLLLYVATRQAIDHIEYWAERFTSENGYKPLALRVLCTIESDVAVPETDNSPLKTLLDNPRYVDTAVADYHFCLGGTKNPNRGFAGCALPVVLCHNTPNNSLYILWGPEETDFEGLFPRVSRHRDF